METSWLHNCAIVEYCCSAHVSSPHPHLHVIAPSILNILFSYGVLLRSPGMWRTWVLHWQDVFNIKKEARLFFQDNPRATIDFLLDVLEAAAINAEQKRLWGERSMGSSTSRQIIGRNAWLSHQKGKKDKIELQKQRIHTSKHGEKWDYFSTVANHETIFRGWPITAILRNYILHDHHA